MKTASRLTVSLLLVLFSGVFMWCPSQAQAWFKRGDHDRGYNHHDHYPYGRVSVALPHGYFEIGFGKHKYFYHAGLFYLASAREYVVVPPPTGVVVYQIPEGWHTVVIDGVAYYSYNGIYYTRVPQGYQVVQPPTTIVVEPATVTANVVPDQPQQEFTINIPNAKGGYVSVVIKRSGTGFVGPQGEFYPEFPKVAQLQAMYVK